MSQTKWQSDAEMVARSAVGLTISWSATLVVLPWFGHPPSVADGFGITFVFTALSRARGYLLRRLFNHVHNRSQPVR